MAEVRLIFTDGEEPGTVDLNTEFNPPVVGSEVTDAQMAAYFAVKWLVEVYFGSDELGGELQDTEATDPTG